MSIPAGPNQAGVPAPPHVHYAGFWIRVVAYLVDGVLQSIMIGAVVAVVGLAYGHSIGDLPDEEDVPASLLLAMTIAYLAILLGYQAIFVGGRWQATPGKLVCGIHIIRTDGRKIGAGLAIGRCLATFLSSAIMNIGFIMIAFTDQKKGLHDLICDTRVIYGRV